MAEHYRIILGTRNWSSWSLRPWLALKATGAPHEDVVIALRQPDTAAKIKHYSGSARLPVLQISANGKSETVWDSLAICETLAERHPDARLWPESPSVRAEARSYSAEMHSGFAALRGALPMDFARTLPTPVLNEEARGDIARVLEAWGHALEHHADKDGFLFGRFSIADCMYAPVVTRFKTYGIAVPPAVKAYMDRVLALPSMVEWYEASKREVAEGRA